MEKRFGLLMLLFLLLAGSGRALAEEEAQQEKQTVSFSINVTYGQTEARKQLELINEFRTGENAWYWNSDDATKTVFNTSEENTLQPLAYDYELEKAAMFRAAEIALSFQHERPVGGYAWDLYEYTCAGENIAAGYGTYKSSEAVFEGWREDEETYSGQDHRRNLLDPDITAVGVGYLRIGRCNYWVQLFRAPASEAEETPANDAQESVSVEVLPSLIQDSYVRASAEEMEIPCGLSDALPDITVGVQLVQTWSEDNFCPVELPYEWSVEDPSIAEIADGRVFAKKSGHTSLVVSEPTLGGTLSIPVTVRQVSMRSLLAEPGNILVPAKEPPTI